MGRKGSWFSSVKKVFISDSKKNQKHHHNKSKLACFGHHEQYEDGERECGGSTISAVPSLPPRREVKPKTEAEDEQNKQTLSLVLATAVAAGAAVAAAQVAAAEVARLPTVSVPRYPGKTNEEIAAIKIQTAFRGYLARRKVRGLRGLARLKTLVQGQSVQRQAATTLQCMQTLSRLQSQVSARKVRISEENQSFQRQLVQKREKELEKLQTASPVGEEFDVSAKSKEQIEAKMLNRQVAAMRRERALAYASTHQQTWRNTPKSANATFMDPNDPHWGWNWLDRWMATRPWEGQSSSYQNNNTSAKNGASNTMSVGEITKLYSQRDHHQNQEIKNSSPSAQKPSRPIVSKVPSSKVKASSPKVNSWGGNIDSPNIFISKSSDENNRRHSIAVSPVRDNERFALATSPESTRVGKARTKMQSTPSGVLRNGNVEKGGAVSVKKQLSFQGSPAGSRRHSVPTKVGMVSNKNVVVAAIPEEKVKVRNGGSR